MSNLVQNAKIEVLKLKCKVFILFENNKEITTGYLLKFRRPNDQFHECFEDTMAGNCQSAFSVLTHDWGFTLNKLTYLRTI